MRDEDDGVGAQRKEEEHSRGWCRGEGAGAGEARPGATGAGRRRSRPAGERWPEEAEGRRGRAWGEEESMGEEGAGAAGKEATGLIWPREEEEKGKERKIKGDKEREGLGR